MIVTNIHLLFPLHGIHPDIFELNADAELNYLHFPKRNQSEYLHLFRLWSIAALNTKLSLQVLSEYNHLTKQFATNVRFRYNFSEGHDFWLVYSELSTATWLASLLLFPDSIIAPCWSNIPTHFIDLLYLEQAVHNSSSKWCSWRHSCGQQYWFWWTPQRGISHP